MLQNRLGNVGENASGIRDLNTECIACDPDVHDLDRVAVLEIIMFFQLLEQWDSKSRRTRGVSLEPCEEEARHAALSL